MVEGNLDLSDTPITALPDGLTVGGWLDLSNTPIASLPDDLTVGGNLHLSDTPITALPDGLTVGGDLYLRGTQITSLPEDLTGGGMVVMNYDVAARVCEGILLSDALGMIEKIEDDSVVFNYAEYMKLRRYLCDNFG